MKNAKWMLPLTLMMLSGLMSAQSFMASRVVARVPFEYVVNNRIMPAGQSLVKASSMDSRVLAISNYDARQSGLVPHRDRSALIGVPRARTRFPARPTTGTGRMRLHVRRAPVDAGVDPNDFNSYGTRRGNYQVMTRGTFANIRLRNLMAPGTEGGVTIKLPEETPMSIFDAAMAYAEKGTPLVIIAGKEYGSGSSRDWAAKGTKLLGVRAVLVESFERIHRSNLVGMGVLPLQFLPGESAETHGLTGTETISITGLEPLNHGVTVP